MDAVNAFNMELFSMIDVKPPISRAKMMSVTKSAIKAIKFYKHVVQIVEKFIKKCKPELKVPGLYVVDSIVRQSRHQFGVDKDVFAPRFLKNFQDTFQNLYRCPEDDKNKIVRVLNLWQKNGVFDMDIIQPLMDMANEAMVPPPALKVLADPQPEMQPPIALASAVTAVPQLPSPDAIAAVAQLFQSPHGQELQRMLQNFQQADKTLGVAMANNVPDPAQMPVAQLNPYIAHTEKKSSLAEKLLDRFDYDDEPEDITPKELSGQSQYTTEKAFNQFPGQMSNTENVYPHMMGQTDGVEHDGGMSRGEYRMMPDGYHSIDQAYSQSRRNSREDVNMRREGRQRGFGRRSGSRSPRRRRSRSSSRSRRSRHRRSHSRSRDQRLRSRSQDRNEREKDRERRQKGLPSIKSQTLSVCSTTLWVGQLDKKTQQSDVMSLLEEFGQIESINMIPPRGCAYIVMVHRQDAYTALNKLSKGSYKVNQKPVKIAWALNKGIKSAHKKFWDVERGVTYIPWSKVKVEELESYREGGMLDTETLNPEWTNAKDLNKPVAVNGALESVPADGMVTAHIQAPAVQQVAPIRSPPAFPAPIMLSPTAMPPGGASFLPSEFDPKNLAPGSVKPPEDSSTESKKDKGPPSDAGSDNQLGSPVAPVMTLPGPAVMQGPRPGMPPLQPPPGMPTPHMPPFLSPPNLPHMPPQMMFPPERFRMPLPFAPRGPPFLRHPSMGPEGMDNREGRHFRNGRPGFGCPPFHRGRW
ncbi:SR-related and CTD-associated factor 4-like isoform X2 [Paralichthys olivaceus]|uniref:SR-related and CTD-associated factor 4-like isoform X2 n=1 Tax=Paralichthys olivaceus TaxID=8255 RepID=UPI00097DE091|nr:PREDICTED: splicing factor, arginine/serine-rich 15-like isoform X2 [Paralichthys olivaceus]